MKRKNERENKDVSIFMGSKSAWQFSPVSQSPSDYLQPPSEGGLCRRASLLSLITSSGLPEGDYTHTAVIYQRKGWDGLFSLCL